MEPIHRTLVPQAAPRFEALKADIPRETPLPSDSVELSHGQSMQDSPGAKRQPRQQERLDTAQDQNKLDPAEAQFVNGALNPENRKLPDTQQAIDKKLNKVFVLDQGTVEKVYPDDNTGLKHQVFDLRTTSGKLVRVAHNTDVAERVPNLRQGLQLAIKGEFISKDNMNHALSEILGDEFLIFSDDIFCGGNTMKGLDGLIHWTHRATGNNPTHEEGGFVVLTKDKDYHKVIR